MSDLLTRDGHLTELSLERYLAGEVVSDEIQAHIDVCDVCAQRLESMRKDAASFIGRPPSPPQRSLAPVYGALLAAAAAVAIYVAIPQGDGSGNEREPGTSWVEPAEYFRVKGSLNVEFFLNRSEVVTKAKDDDAVYAGDRVGFRVSTPTAGHLMIAGIDGKGEAYLCYPQDNGGRSKAFGPTKSLTTLDQAIVLDEILGREDLVAVFCEDAIEFQQVAGALKGLRSGQSVDKILESQRCRQRTIRLMKKRMEP